MPQGSPLSPLAFNIYTAPLLDAPDLKDSECELQALADDIAAWASDTTLQKAAQKLAHRLAPVYELATTHRMKFSHGPPDADPKPKSKVLTITRKRKLPNPKVPFGPHDLLPAQTAKYLGVTFDRGLTFNTNVNDLFTKKAGLVETIKKYTHTKYGCHQLVALEIVKAHVPSSLEYACEVWVDAPTSALEKLDSIVHKSLARALGVNRLSHRHDVCVEAGVTPLNVRRMIALLRYWVALHKNPRPLTSTLDSLNDEDVLWEQHRNSFKVHVEKLCTRLNITLEHAKTLTKQDLKDLTNTLWRDEWDQARQRRLRQDRTGNYFMLHQSVHFALPSSYAHTDRATLAAWHGLRLHSAPLNEFLHSINCHHTPYCTCERQHESVDHYLLHCTKFAEERKKMFNTVKEFIPFDVDVSKTFLLGNPYLLPDTDIDAIFLAVTKFIRDSERF